MAKKKDEKDAAADFFGDSDLDWLEDEDDEASKAAKSASVMGSKPADDGEDAPQPPPTNGVAGSVADADADRGRLAAAPTVVFSSAADLASQASAAAAAGPEAPAVEPNNGARPPSQIPTLLNIDPAVQAAAAAAVAATQDPEDGVQTDVMPGPTALETYKVLEEDAEPDTSAHPGPPPVPVAMVTAEPSPMSSPPRHVDPLPAAASAPAAPVVRPPTGATPAPAPNRTARPGAAGLGRGRGEERTGPSKQGWQATLGILVGEATAVGTTSAGTGRGLLLERAASVAARQLDDLNRSIDLFAEAKAAGRNTEALLRVQVEALGRLGRYAEQLSVLVELSEQLTEQRKSDALLEAGLVAWRRLDQPAVAIKHLRTAAQEDAKNYTARALLRALLPGQGNTPANERMNLLDQLAELSEGGIAADAYMEAATVADEAGESMASRARLEHALDAKPGHIGAFLRLERMLSNDAQALASLYEREAARPGQTEAGWWHAEAARAHQRAGQSEDAVRGFNAAVAEGYPFALRELQGTYVQTGAWFELEDALAREAAALSPEEGQAFTLYRLGWLREARIENADAALEAYESAVAADPTSAPAADAVARLLRNKHDRQRAFWKERLDRATLPAERRFLTLQLAEDAESDGQFEQARDGYRDVLEGVPVGAAAEVARAGLERVYKRLQDRTGLAELRRQQATMAASASERALWLHEAASILSSPMTAWPPEDEAERNSAVTALMSALEAEPDHPAALGSMTLLLGAGDRWRELAQILESAAKATTDEHRRAAYLYRAGRIYAEKVSDDETARVCLGRALAAAPAFRPARWLLRTVSGPGDAAGDASIYREEARHAEGRSERAWSLFAAAEVAGPGPAARQDLQRILSESADHAGALAALEVHCVADGDEESLTHIYLRALEGSPSTSKARVAARAAVLLERSGKGARSLEVLRRVAKMPVEGVPLRACARTALRLGDQELAVELLSATKQSEDAVEALRLRASSTPPAEALPQLMDLLKQSPEALGVAARAATLAQQLGDSDAMLKAYATIARNAKSSSLSAAYGSWTGMQLQASGKDMEALEFWRIAHAGRANSIGALDGVVRGLVAHGDADALADLKGLSDERLSIALADAGAPERGGALLAATTSAPGLEPAAQLGNLLLLEQLHEAAEQWQDAYAALVQRRNLCNDPQVLAEADQKKRWILAEHLADTDAAWDLYRQLHSESPGDREVTEALARIAGARGDVDMAIGYLRELASTASSTEEAARYQRRVGEVHERSGEADKARQAYEDALGHLGTDLDALAGLKRLAEADSDWPEVVAVMEREVAVSQGQRRVDLRRQIAEVHEARVKDPAQTMKAWRALVELAPTDRPGLEQLLALSEAEQEWAVFVDTGAALAEVSSGADRGALLRRVGMACEDHLGRDDAAKFYQQAVSVTPPDAIAAKRLEGLARARADWGAAVGALALQARADVSVDSRIDALLSAARLEVEARHDRVAAADFYRQILDIREDHEPSLRFMASHLFETGQHGEALAISRRLEPFVETNQDLDDFDTRMELSSFYFFFAEMLRAQGDHPNALKRYSRALELNPTHLPSLQAIGPLYTEAQQWDEAEQVYRALQLSGGHGDRQQSATTYTQLGLVERELGNTDKAYKRFNKALELHPNHVGALKGMALVLSDRKDWSNLLNVYNNIIYHAAVPEDVIDAYMTKGRILDVHMKRQDKASQHYQRSLDFDPHQPLAFLRLAELSLRRKAYREAGELAEKALQLDEDLVRPHRALLLLVRAAAWNSAGRASEAQRCLREAGVLDRSLSGELGATPLADPAIIERVLNQRMH